MLKQQLKSIVLALSFLAAALGASAASATVVTFSGLSGNNGDPFTSYTESNVTVQTVAGTAKVAMAFGAPVPDVFFNGSIQLRVSSTSTFVFNAIDLAAVRGSLSYTVQGYANNAQLWSMSSVLADTNSAFVTVNGSNSAAVDYLLLTLTANGTSSNLDNINVSFPAAAGNVPEPASVSLFGLAAAALALARRRRRA